MAIEANIMDTASVKYIYLLKKVKEENEWADRTIEGIPRNAPRHTKMCPLGCEKFAPTVVPSHLNMKDKR